MPSDARQAPTAPHGRHLVLYDGVCGLCHGIVQFLIARDPDGLFDFASLQSRVAEDLLRPYGADPKDLDTLHVLLNYRGEHPVHLTRGRAPLALFGALGWPWPALRVFAILPTGMLDAAYNLVARRRYRWFGQSDRCLLPRPEFRDRFIDSTPAAPPPSQEA
jgi:predicted DCC family thiol-disulfide oxidoreductase YuxK